MIIAFLIVWSTIFTLQNFSKIRPTCQMPRPQFLELHYLYRIVFGYSFLRIKFVMNEVVLILIL